MSLQEKIIVNYIHVTYFPFPSRVICKINEQVSIYKQYEKQTKTKYLPCPLVHFMLKPLPLHKSIAEAYINSTFFSTNSVPDIVY